METAIGGVGTPTEPTETEPVAPGADDSQIVIIRPQILENVGHVLGNLFQRIYHLIDRSREADAVTATQLDGAAHRLEDFLQLVIDYVAPLALSLQRVPTTDVAQSLAQQLSDRLGCRVNVESQVQGEGQLLVDPGRLARGFRLMVAQLREGAAAGETMALKVVERPAARSLALSAALPGGWLLAPSSESEMQRSVAEKLMEIQGGALQEKSAPSGEVLWEIVLPLQP